MGLDFFISTPKESGNSGIHTHTHTYMSACVLKVGIAQTTSFNINFVEVLNPGFQFTISADYHGKDEDDDDEK